jgi:hypothetical protein
MLIWTPPQVRSVAHGAPTPLLTHLAGEHATRIARLWAPPYLDFLAAPAERRQLLCLAVSLQAVIITPALADQLLAWPLRRAVKAAVPQAPAGLARALTQLGEVAWPAEDYAGLLELLAEPKTARILRHASPISVDRVRALAGLSAPLRRAGLGGADLGGAQAQLLNEVYDALARRDGEAAADAAALRWAAGNSPADVFARARSSIRRAPGPDPLPPSPHLRYLGDLEAIAEVGGRYGNCLGSLEYVGDRDFAIYEWLGEPGAVVELADDRLFGWRLREVKLANNEAVPTDQRAPFIEVLRALGVHVGRCAGGVSRSLAWAESKEFELDSRDQAIADVFND